MRPTGTESLVLSRPPRSCTVLVRGGLLAADVFSAVLAAVLAFAALSALHAAAGAQFTDGWKVLSERWTSFPVVAAGITCWFFVKGHYQSRMAFWEETAAVVAACGFALLAEGFLLFSNKADVSRLSTFGTWIVAPFIIMATRTALKDFMHRRGAGLARVLVVGRERETASAVRVLSSDRHMGYTVCGAMETASLEAVIVAARNKRADTIVIALSGADPGENMLAASVREKGFNVVLVPPLLGFAAAGVRMQYVIGQDFILIVDKPEVLPGLSRIGKRAFDMAVSAAVLCVAALPMAAVAAIVRLDGGPALFGHERVGAGGRKFMCLKFRSMAADAHGRLEDLLATDDDARQEWDRTRKLRYDPRVTRFGRFIRRTAVDELPQLLNVIRGEMSLVGPRPVTESELRSHYGASASLYTSVRPGLTGLWQVSGRNDVSYEERVALDAWYVRNWSAWHDLAIVLKTVPALLTKRGAY